jgi:hypothetical protein
VKQVMGDDFVTQLYQMHLRGKRNRAAAPANISGTVPAVTTTTPILAHPGSLVANITTSKIIIAAAPITRKYQLIIARTYEAIEEYCLRNNIAHAAKHTIAVT